MAREITWKGLSEEEAKNLEMDRFLQLIPSRRRRSITRGFTEQQKLLLRKIENNEKNIKTHCRNMVILPSMVGHTLNVYTGKSFEAVEITVEKLGHCLGEFALSRKVVSHSSAGVGSTRSSKVSAR